MLDVEASLGGKLIRLGDIAPNDFASGRVVPIGDSDILIAFSDPAGNLQQLRLDIYITGGYRGRVDADIADGQVKSSQDKTTVGLY
jgi:hypothetical protein